MDFLILSPPVTTPSEPPCGAFLLAAGLAARGADVGMLDLSLEFFHRLFENADATTRSSMTYLWRAIKGYAPMTHRSVTGHLHRHLGRLEGRFSGWRLTLMDIAPPERIHDPRALVSLFERRPSPFEALWGAVLAPALDALKPKNILISLAYLSQLPAAVDLVRFLKTRGIVPLVGGSLPKSLSVTGHGIESLRAVFPRIATGDGMTLLDENEGTERLLDDLTWPRLVSEKPYFTARPVIPLALSSGCFWNRCLFCPDRNLPFGRVPEPALDKFMRAIPKSVLAARPLIHLVDSSLPPSALRAFLPLSSDAGTGFFGFARPTRHLLKDGLLADSAKSGCRMLQLGVESGSKILLDRYQKGIDPGEAREVIRESAHQGIRNYAYLLFGLPGETPRDLQKTLAFTLDNAGDIDFLNLSLFNLPRYCELSEKAPAFGIDIQDFPGQDQGIRLYRPFTARGVDTRQQARDFLKSVFKAHPTIREIHLRTPRWLRAAHLALMFRSARNTRVTSPECVRGA
jgi:hypothetical protein